MLRDKEKISEFLQGINSQEAEVLLYEWELWARDEQLPPAGAFWNYWVVLAGRGFGKTRTGAEWVRSKVEAGLAGRVALVAKDPGEARDVMIEGESGLLSVCPPWNRPAYRSSLKRLEWPSGARAFVYSSDDYEELRGPQHDLAWVDELFKMRNQQEVWDQLMFGLRIGDNPQACVTSTPRPTQLLKMVMADPATIMTRGSTYDNLANLSPRYRGIIERFEGTRLGRQELLAEILDDVPGALWNYGLIDKLRVARAPVLRRIVVAIDPSVTSKAESAETGIIAAGLGEDDHAYVLRDSSLRATPDQWARVAIASLNELLADRIIAEVNNGGDLVEAVLRAVDYSVPYRAVYASRGKVPRAEPISALYEQGRVHHVGAFPELEDQMCAYDPLISRVSPDRMDALVWALTELFDVAPMDLSTQADVGPAMLSASRWLE